MPVNNQFKDGSTYSYNSVTLSVTNPSGATHTSAMTLIAENLTLTRPTEIIQVRTHLNLPGGQQITTGFVTGTATLQLLSAHDVEVGATFTQDFGLGNESFLISQVGKQYAQGDAIKQNVDFVKTYGTVTGAAS